MHLVSSQRHLVLRHQNHKQPPDPPSAARRLPPAINITLPHVIRPTSTEPSGTTLWYHPSATQLALTASRGRSRHSQSSVSAIGTVISHPFPPHFASRRPPAASPSRPAPHTPAAEPRSDLFLRKAGRAERCEWRQLKAGKILFSALHELTAGLMYVVSRLHGLNGPRSLETTWSDRPCSLETTFVSTLAAHTCGLSRD